MEQPQNYYDKYNDASVLDTFDNVGQGAAELESSWLGRIWNDLTGKSAQNREFAQQEYLQDKMNEYNLPANQMARMKAAGINPLTAAGQVAQGGNESAQAPQVASNSQGVSQGLGALAGVAGAVTGGIGDVAGAELAGSQANEINSLLGLKRAQLAANTAHELASAGYEKSLADYWGTKAAYASTQEALDVLGKVYSIKHVKKDIRRLDDEHNISLKDLEIRKQQLSQEEYRTQMMAIDKFFQDERKRIYEAVGVDTTKAENQMLIEAEVNGTIDTVVGAFRRNAYEIASAGYSAQSNSIYDIVYNQTLAQAAGNAEYAKYLNDLEKNKAEYTAFIQAIYSLPSDVKGLIVQYLGKSENAVLRSIATGFEKSPDYQAPYVNPRHNGYRPRW